MLTLLTADPETLYAGNSYGSFALQVFLHGKLSALQAF